MNSISVRHEEYLNILRSEFSFADQLIDEKLTENKRSDLLSIVQSEFQTAARSGFSKVEGRMRIDANELLLRHASYLSDERNAILDNALLLMKCPRLTINIQIPWSRTLGLVIVVAVGLVLPFYMIWESYSLVNYFLIKFQLLGLDREFAATSLILSWYFMVAILHEALWLYFKKFNSRRSKLVGEVTCFFENKLREALNFYDNVVNKSIV